MSKEKGELAYLAAAVGLFTVIFVTIFCVYFVELQLLQQSSEINLHISESASIVNEFNKTDRAYIIPEAKNNKSDNLSNEEREQVKQVGEKLEDNIRSTFDLNDNMKAKSGVFRRLCQDRAFEIHSVKIFQPVYDESFKQTEKDGNIRIEKMYVPKGIKLYILKYDNKGNYLPCSMQKWYPIPDGKSLNELNGIPDDFQLHQLVSDSNIKTGLVPTGAVLEVGLKMEPRTPFRFFNTDSTKKTFFGDNTANTQIITAWQSIDIKPANDDERDKE